MIAPYTLNMKILLVSIIMPSSIVLSSIILSQTVIAVVSLVGIMIYGGENSQNCENTWFCAQIVNA